VAVTVELEFASVAVGRLESSVDVGINESSVVVVGVGDKVVVSNSPGAVGLG